MNGLGDFQDLVENLSAENYHLIRDKAVSAVHNALRDGRMDIVHAWRNMVGADLVALILNIPWGLPPGIGDAVLKSDSDILAWFADHKAFSVVNIGSTAFKLAGHDKVGMVYTHELGHNLGCHHSPGEDDSPPPPENRYHEYAVGHKFLSIIGWTGTIMTNPDISTWLSWPVKYFSNPDVLFLLGRTGIANERDNARLIEETAIYVADYRDGFPSNSIWVDVAYNGYAGTKIGTFSRPYTTVTEGIYYVEEGGTIVFEQGSDSWTGTINKPMTLTAGIGEMVIGQ